MTFDTQTYIDTLAAAHGLAAKPGDTDRVELTVRAVRTELADIKRRTQTLQAWSAAVIADHRAETTGPGRAPVATIDPARPGCRCALRRPDRQPGCRCKTRHH